LKLDAPLTVTPAQNAANYSLFVVGRRGRPVGRAILLRSVVYDRETETVTATLRHAVRRPGAYLLVVNGKAPAGLVDPSGVLLDGAGRGEPGQNFVTTLRTAPRSVAPLHMARRIRQR
jgi:hypothetical protein